MRPADYPDFPALKAVAPADERDRPTPAQVELLHDLGHEGAILDRFHAWKLIERLKRLR